MKTFITFFAIAIVSFTVNAQEFRFEQEVINYGKVAKGSDKIRVFEFTNVGDAPLIIDRIKPACGCTVPKKPEKPIMPGEKGQIEVSYNTNIVGGFSKSMTIFSNAKNERKILRIKGHVVKGLSPTKEKSMLSTNN